MEVRCPAAAVARRLRVCPADAAPRRPRPAQVLLVSETRWRAFSEVPGPVAQRAARLQWGVLAVLLRTVASQVRAVRSTRDGCGRRLRPASACQAAAGVRRKRAR